MFVETSTFLLREDLLGRFKRGGSDSQEEEPDLVLADHATTIMLRPGDPSSSIFCLPKTGVIILSTFGWLFVYCFLRGFSFNPLRGHW